MQAHLRRVLAALLLAAPPASAAPEPDPDLTEGDEVDLTAVPTETPAGPSPEVLALTAAVDALQARVVELEARPIPPPPPEPAPEPPPPPWHEVLDLRVSGYVQLQAEFNQLSQDELAPDGRALNQDRFLVRRGRLRVDRTFEYAHAGLEIDANTVRGPFLSLRRAEASVFLPHRDEEGAPRTDLPPYVMLTAGLSEIPFGFELRQGNAERWFVERTTGSLAFFRGEPDSGVRLSGALGPLRYAAAVQNGVPVDDRPGAQTEALVRRKTLVGRVGLEASSRRTSAAAGASWLDGQGLHTGTPATKSVLLWRDLNQDGLVTLNELSANLGQAGSPSLPFRRWAVGGDVQLGVRTPLGWTRVVGEAILASNLDRGYLPADPIATGYDLRHTLAMVAVTQEVTRWGLVGFRADRYDPNADLDESRRGRFVPVDASVSTLSALAGVRFEPLARLVVQYDYVSDHLGRDARGVPVDLPNDSWIARLQVEF